MFLYFLPCAYSKASVTLEPRVSPPCDQFMPLISSLVGGTALVQKEVLQGRGWTSDPGDPSAAKVKKGLTF